MTRRSPHIALCAALELSGGDAAPEWLHLLPAGGARTHDGRGPYRIIDPVQLMASSLKDGEKLVLDENHATDLAAPKGEPAPARGWIVELQHRADGIWGRVEWTGEGRRLADDKAYRGVSPVISHRADGVITRILRASLTNKPNLVGLTSLHQEDNDMNLREKLIEALGLDSDADDDAIIAALRAKLETGGKPAPEAVTAALQSALSPIAQAAGLAANADVAAVLAGVQQLANDQGGNKVMALQSQLANVTQQLNDLRDDGKRERAEAFVDAAIGAKRVGVKVLRDDYIAMHMEDPEKARRHIEALPVLSASRTGNLPPKGRDNGDLTDEQRSVVALMGLDPEEYKKTLAAEASQEEAL